MHMAKMQHSKLLQLLIAYFSRDIKLNYERHKVLWFGARTVHKIIAYFSAGEYVHLFIMPASVRDWFVSVPTHCEHSYIALIYGFCYEF